MPSAAVQNRQPICPYTASGRASRRISPHAKRDSPAGRGTHTICYIIGRSELFYGSPRSFGGNAEDQVRKRAKSPSPLCPVALLILLPAAAGTRIVPPRLDRKSTRLNSSHLVSS